MYGKNINGVLYIVFVETGGYKPMQFTDAPDAPNGYTAAFFWREDDEGFVQTWEFVPESDEEELTAEEAIDVLLGNT